MRNDSSKQMSSVKPMSDVPMVDTKKRQTLKIIGAGAAVVATPASVAALGWPNAADQRIVTDEYAGTVQEMYEDIEFPLTGQAELSISLRVDPEPVLVMGNNTDDLIIVRHVHPGIVHAGDRAFDINSVFERCAYAISPHTKRSVAIHQTSHVQKEREFARFNYSGKPQRLVVVTGADKQGLLAYSSRSFFA